MLSFAGSGMKIIAPTPSFIMYKAYAESTSSEFIEIELNDDFSMDWDKLKELSNDPDLAMIILCTPNNPTGNLLDKNEMENFIRGTNKLVVVDEAYYEFSGETIVNLCHRYSNLVVTRTFSKAFSLAGMRIGYLNADQSIIKLLKSVKSPYNTNLISQEIARQVLINRELIKPYWKKIINSRNYLWNEMNTIKGLKVYPTDSNFILFNTEIPEEEVYKELELRGIKIRFFSKLPVTADILRVSIGKENENEYFIDNLKEIIKGW
jgi:histidinol-phosphate aminotransferase